MSKLTKEIMRAYLDREYPNGRTQSIKELRAKLHAENPHCYYCGAVTDISEEIYNNFRTANSWDAKAGMYDYMATVEHLYEKYDIRRYTELNSKVLSCYSCNHQRGSKRSKRIDKNSEFYVHPDIRRQISNQLLS